MFGIKALLVKELGWMIGIVLTAFYIAFILVSQYLGLNQSGGLNTGIVGFLTL
jgi:hypothetical protein